jgi:methyl-accepting chemotaxis protein
MVEQATAAAHSLREETDALSDLIAQFRVGDTGPVAVNTSSMRKPNPVHVAQQKLKSFIGGGRSHGAAATASAPAAPEPWEEF